MLEQIKAHAAAEYPRECCGLVVEIHGEQTYHPCINLAKGEDHFIIAPQSYLEAESKGSVVAVVHSHPNGPLRASQADQYKCNKMGIPWHIISWPAADMITIQPSSEPQPLLRREFAHGVMDCYTAIRDFYAAAGIELGDYDRHDEWWNQGLSLYMDNVEKEGFTRIHYMQDLQPGDLIFMNIRSPEPNHAAVYLGNNLIFHHLPNRLSETAVYGGYFLKCTCSYWRHSQWQPSAFTDTLKQNLGIATS